MIGRILPRLATRLRFPQLFFLTFCLFLLDLVIPDAIPLVDEALLGLLTLLLGSLRTRRVEDTDEEDEGRIIEGKGRVLKRD